MESFSSAKRLTCIHASTESNCIQLDLKSSPSGQAGTMWHTHWSPLRSHISGKQQVFNAHPMAVPKRPAGLATSTVIAKIHTKENPQPTSRMMVPHAGLGRNVMFGPKGRKSGASAFAIVGPERPRRFAVPQIHGSHAQRSWACSGTIGPCTKRCLWPRKHPTPPPPRTWTMPFNNPWPNWLGPAL